MSERAAVVDEAAGDRPRRLARQSDQCRRKNRDSKRAEKLATLHLWFLASALRTFARNSASNTSSYGSSLRRGACPEERERRRAPSLGIPLPTFTRSPVDLVELLAVVPHEYLIVETIRAHRHRSHVARKLE